MFDFFVKIIGIGTIIYCLFKFAIFLIERAKVVYRSDSNTEDESFTEFDIKEEKPKRKTTKKKKPETETKTEKKTTNRKKKKVEVENGDKEESRSNNKE